MTSQKKVYGFTEKEREYLHDLTVQLISKNPAFMEIAVITQRRSVWLSAEQVELIAGFLDNYLCHIEKEMGMSEEIGDAIYRKLTGLDRITLLPPPWKD